MNATFVTLARNSDVWAIAGSIVQVEDRFNHNFHYDWVFLNDKPFNDEFKRITSNLVSGRARYGLVPKEHWSYPSWIDQEKAAAARIAMKGKEIEHGDSESYRHMCRYEAGFFFQHPLMLEYKWYWRVEPGIQLFCNIDYDPFKFLADNNKKYSFVLSLFESKATVATLWDTVRKFIQQHPGYLARNNSMGFLSDDGGETYNYCHFWSNFEIGSLEWLRSRAYSKLFNYLDQEGGFFYERWGDAPIHSIAAGLLLDKHQIHFFNDVGYFHHPFMHCPNTDEMRHSGKCRCDPYLNFDWQAPSCLSKYYNLQGLLRPALS